jgi:DNA-binding transcriptional ArsR family regulator
MTSPHRRYKAGERIRLGPESVLEVISGVVALTILHEDGAEVLLGLLGPGQVLAGHSRDVGYLQCHAHADTAVWVQPWSKAVLQPGFAERLRDRLRTLEAWAAMQARPSLERRLLGILSLLAEQFGRPTSQGVEIEVGITQSQLASAVGATRSTVTRLLGRLRRRGLLIAVRSGRSERYWLPRWEGREHSPAEPQERCDFAPLHRQALV